MAAIRKENNMLLRLAMKRKQGSNKGNHRLNTNEHSLTTNRLSKCTGLCGALVNENWEYSSSF